MSRTLLSLAGFQVIISGRFWVIAEVAKLKGLATARIPAGAFKSENTWKEYLKGKHVQEKERPLSALRRLGRKEAQSSAPSPLTQPPEKIKSVLRRGLGRLT